jgi:GGDEF domain-containing protein
MREALDAAGVAASIGRASYDPNGGLVRTWWQADRAMYVEKQRRRRTTSVVVLP